MANSATVTLTRGSTSVELPGPPPGTNVRGPEHYVTGATVDGTRHSYKTNSDTKRQWTVPLVDLSATQKADLETFYSDHAQGPTNTWTYRHTNGQNYVARFVNTRLEFLRGASELWNVTLGIEAVGVVT